MSLIVDSLASGGASTGISSPNKFGVYVDGVERIAGKGRAMRAEIIVVCCEDGLWRWATDFVVFGSPWSYMGGGGMPHADSPGCASRSDALRDAANFLRERMRRCEANYKVTHTTSSRELFAWLEDIGLGETEQLVLF